MRVGMLPNRAIGAAIAILAVVAPTARAGAAPPSACSAASGVTVIVDFTHFGGNIERGRAPGRPATALAVLRAAGFETAGTSQYGDAFLCRVDGLPSTKHESCTSTPPANSSWAFYWARPTDLDWTYASTGVTGYQPAAGTIIAFAFGNYAEPGIVPMAALAGPTTTTTVTSATASAATVVATQVTTRSTAPTGPEPPGSTTPPKSANASTTTPASKPSPASSHGATSTPVVPRVVERTAAGVTHGSSGSPWPTGLALALVAILAGGGWLTLRAPPAHGMSNVAALRLPRRVHPVAWWIWAIGLAVTASRTTNPLLLALVLAVGGIVVAARRIEAPWARAYKWYLLLGLIVIAFRIGFRVLLGGDLGPGEHVLFTIPNIPLPKFMAGVQLGGAVSAESVLSASYDGLRLATLLCCIGAANTLANPKRALRVLPAALYELGVTITVAITVAPQLVESVQRVRRARKLRGDTARGRRAVRGIAMPVLHDALDRSFQLAAAMDSRGYGRNGAVPARVRRLTATLLLAGLLGLCLGTYGLLDTSTPSLLGAPTLALGIAFAAGGLALGGRRIRRTRYRPDPWAFAEWCTVLSGAAAAIATIVAASHNASALNPSTFPLAWPTLPPLPTAGILCALLPAVLTPPPPVAAPGPPRLDIDTTTRTPVGAHT